MIFTLFMRPHGACEEYEDDEEEVDDVEDIRKDWSGVGLIKTRLLWIRSNYN